MTAFFGVFFEIQFKESIQSLVCILYPVPPLAIDGGISAEISQLEFGGYIIGIESMKIIITTETILIILALDDCCCILPPLWSNLFLLFFLAFADDVASVADADDSLISSILCFPSYFPTPAKTITPI